MTSEEKQLLLKDLSARLPYGVKFTSFSENMKYHSEPTTLRQIFYNEEYDANNIEGDNDISSILDLIKPYLRPMLSMTEEEKKQFFKLKQMSVTVIVPNVNRLKIEYIVDLEDDGDGLNHLYDWLNAHHFDYRGLIPMGLALEAPEGMY